MSSDDEKAQTRAALVGAWNVNAGGMTAVVVLTDNGNYSNTLTSGMQGHSGTWSVVDAYGAQCIYFKLQTWYPKEYVGPLGSVTIQMPSTETWGITRVEPNCIHLFGGGGMFRAQSLQDVAAPSQFAGASDPATAAPTGAPGTVKSLWHDIEHFIKKPGQ